MLHGIVKFIDTINDNDYKNYAVSMCRKKHLQLLFYVVIWWCYIIPLLGTFVIEIIYDLSYSEIGCWSVLVSILFLIVFDRETIF